MTTSEEARAEYTPTTERIRASYVYFDERYDGSIQPEAAREFDRWLAAHDAEVLAAAQRPPERDPLDPEDREVMDTMIRASEKGIGSIHMFAQRPPVSPEAREALVALELATTSFIDTDGCRSLRVRTNEEAADLVLEHFAVPTRSEQADPLPWRSNTGVRFASEGEFGDRVYAPRPAAQRPPVSPEQREALAQVIYEAAGGRAFPDGSYAIPATVYAQADAILAHFTVQADVSTYAPIPELDPEKVAEAIGGHYWQVQRDAQGFDTGGIDCSCGMWSGPNHEGYRPHPAHRAHQAAALIAALPELVVKP